MVVVVGWVFFRAKDLNTAIEILRAMVDMNGASMPDAFVLHARFIATLLSSIGIIFTPGGGHDFAMNYIWIVSLLIVVFLAPNTQQIMGQFNPALNYISDKVNHMNWLPNWKWAVAMAVVLACGLLSLVRPSEFLYFQF
jgi:hypothetical protein